MGRFRSFVRRVAKPVAMVAVVGSVSLSLIVTTPSTAEALVKYRDIKAAETFVMGATKTLAPVAQAGLVAASFSPVGLGIRLLQLGMIAYSTSDIWLPLVAGAFGAAEDKNTPAGAGAQRATITGYTRSGTDNNTFNITYAWSGTASTNWYQQFGAIGKCKRTSDGLISYASKNGWWSMSSGANNFSYSIALTPCPAGWTTVGWKLGGGTSTWTQGGSWTPSLNSGGSAATFEGSGQYQFGAANILEGGDWGQPSFDPYSADTKYKVKSECINTDGSKSTIEAESSGDYIRFPSCEAAGKGHGTGKNTITGLAPGSTQEKTLWDSPAAPSDPSTPLCDASRPTGGCVMSIELDGKPCTSADIECQNWAELEKNEPNNPRLKCKLGPYTLPTASCALLEKAYFPGGAPATEENTDGNPDTSKSTDPAGNPLANPAPTNTPQSVPGSAGQPVPGASGSPEEKMANCFPTGWAVFNPVEWVLKPLRCAFEPSEDPKAKIEAAQARAGTKAPFVWMTGGGALVAGASSSLSNNCPDWTINVAGLSQNVVCESSFTQAIVNSRGLLFGAMVIAMFWPLIRSLWYAVVPVLRPAPTGQ